MTALLWLLLGPGLLPLILLWHLTQMPVALSPFPEWPAREEMRAIVPPKGVMEYEPWPTVC